jgi:plastocyanin
MLTTLISSLLLAKSNVVSGTVTFNNRPVADAVVWLDGSPKSKPIKAAIVQKGKKFTPRILVVTSGSTVEFPNRDDIFHNVFAEYRAKKFDLGMYKQGETRSVIFDKTGVVSVLCNVHSNMSAYVVVVDTPFYVKTDKSGRYSIPNVTSGSYTVHAWHESGATYKSTTNIQGTVALNFGLAR